MFKLKKLGFMGVFVLLGAAIIAPCSSAGLLSQDIKVTFNTPVRIPENVLPAGTYWFTVPEDDPGFDNVMKIYNADHTKLLAEMNTETMDETGGFGQDVTINGIHWPTGQVVLTVAKTGDQQPPILVGWHYPGRTDGHRLVYNSEMQNQIDNEQHETIAVNPGYAISRSIGSAAFE